jgi:hypothetical protein
LRIHEDGSPGIFTKWTGFRLPQGCPCPVRWRSGRRAGGRPPRSIVPELTMPRPHPPPGFQLPRFRDLTVFTLLALTLLAGEGAAQASTEVDGRVSDPDGRPVRGVAVSLGAAPIGTFRTVETDEAGYFRIGSLQPGSYLIRYVRIGFAPVEEEVEVVAGERIRADVVLVPTAVPLEGFGVEGVRSRTRALFEDQAGLTSRELSVEEIRRLPGLAESDPLRAVEVLPGVISPTDFSASFSVRGGSSDQNLILLDGFPIYNPFHLGGVFSVFNTDMVDRVELQTGGFPARFGGRVSSVLRVESDAGPGEFSVNGGVSFLAARVAVSGGIGSELRERLGWASARWRVSARRSYIDQLVRPFAELPYHITDLQGIGEVWTSGGSRITLTAYTGADVLALGGVSGEDFPLRLDWDWGNDLVGLRWTRGLEDGGMLEAGAGVTGFSTTLAFTDFDDSAFSSEVRQLSAFASAERWIGSEWKGALGASVDRYTFDNLARTGGTTFADSDGAGTAISSFAQAEWSSPGRWRVELGLRADAWTPDSGSSSMNPGPRLAVKRFLADGDAAINLSLGRYTQFAHSLRDEELPLGIDIWVLAGDRAPHVVSDQFQVGVERFVGDHWFLAAHGFYRSFDGVITNNFADDPNDPLDDLLAGRGRGYGADFFVERSADRVEGSLSVSMLKADRTFPDFRSGLETPEDVTYAPIFDRRIDLDLVLRFPLPGAWTGGLRWHVGSGLPYTRPLASYPFLSPRPTLDGRLDWQWEPGDEGELPYGIVLGPRNDARYPAYHRLDLSARRTYTRSWGAFTPYLDILNVYNQRNVLFYFFDFSSDPPVRTGLSMFPLLPSIGVEVNF